MIYWNERDQTQNQCDGKDQALTSGRVLIVEDDPVFANSVLRLLAMAKIDAASALTGLEALARLKVETFDLALVDINLPDMTGHQVIQSIKEADLNLHTIVVSGETEINVAILALRLGALDFVRKPIEPDMLLHVVRRALKQHCMEREHREFQQRIAHSERLHRFLVDRSRDIIFVLDRDGCITYINDRIDSLLGIKPKTVLGWPLSRLVHEHDSKRVNYEFSSRKLSRISRHHTELRLNSELEKGGFRHFDIHLDAISLREDDGQEHDYYYGVARDITAHRVIEEQATYQLNHDAVTGLPNRSLFRDHLGLALIQAKRNGDRLAVLFLNVDRFKHVNDLCGHAKADELLREIGERIQRCLRGGDTLSRFGGDEFLLLNNGVRSNDEVLAIVDRINAELALPYRCINKNLQLTMSAGISLFPEHGDNADALIRHANIALYHGRLSGNRSHTFFMHEMGVSTNHRLDLENALRQAIGNDELELHFQPQVDLKTRRIKGMEALVRWQHPSLGLLPPGEFLPVAEETGLIINIGEWVTRKVCSSFKRWQEQGIAPPRIAINISPMHLDQSDFVNRFTAMLEEYQVAPQLIEVELTENMFIRDPGSVAQKLQSLASHGVKIAIDDFGTQYSSLSYLQKFPIHTLKIDKSFVWEIDREYRQHAIIKAIISIAHGLGLNLVAEGVETDTQLNFLESQGCDEIQGYLVSKPLNIPAIESLLRLGLPNPQERSESTISNLSPS